MYLKNRLFVFFLYIFAVAFLFVFVVTCFMFILPLESRIKKPSGLSFLITISSVNDLFKIPIQILCMLFEICSVSSVFNFEVKCRRESFGKITVTFVSYLLNCIGKSVTFLAAKIKSVPFLGAMAFSHFYCLFQILRLIP